MTQGYMKNFKTLITGLLLVSGLLSASQASAHATPLLYEPDASAVLQALPSEVSIKFSEHIEPKASSILVYGPDGQRANNGNPWVDLKDSRLFKIRLIDKGQGSYTVSWQVVSADDGHFTQGAYTFSVGHLSANANQPAQSGFQIRHSSSIPEGITIGFELIGEALLLGLLVIIAFIWRPMRRKYFADALSSADTIILKRLNLSLIFAVLLIFAGGISYFIFKTNELAKLQESAFGATFWVFFSTVSARYTFYRLLSIAFFFAVFWASRKRILSSEKFTKTEIALFLLLAFTAFARARVSHAAASNFYPNFSIAINFIHLYFKDLWIGGILALLILFSPIIKQLQNVRLTTFVLTSFSKITSVSLGVAGVTGVYVIWLHLKGFDNVLTTDWGQKFIILSVFAAGLFITRMLHQLWIEPKVVRAISSHLKTSLDWIPITFAFEAGAGVFVLLVTSILIITTPPIAPHYDFIRQTESQGAKITLTQDPYESAKFLVTAESLHPKRDSVSNLIVTLTNHDRNIGPISAVLEQRFWDGYVFDENQLSPPGNWQIDITAQSQGSYDAVASFNVNYPDEINFAKAHAQDRIFDSFAVLSILVGLVILIFAVFLYRFSSKLNHLAIIQNIQYPRLTLPSARVDGGQAISNIHLLYDRGAWGVPVVVGVLVLFLLGGGHGGAAVFFQSDFQKLCEKNSDVTFFAWHESVPERAGQAKSDVAVPGCMLGSGLGQYHFADIREFEQFTRPAEAQAIMRTEPKIIEAGKPETFIFSIQDYSGKPVQELSFDHDRVMHVVIASADFSVYAHIHAEDAGPITPEMLKKAEFPVQYTFPKSGKYLLSLDYTVRAKPFSQQFYVNVGGLPSQAPEQQEFSLYKNFEGYDVRLTTSANLKSGKPASLSYHITKDNQPVLDLQPYLSVPMHISVISDDHLKYTHIHGMLPLSWLDKLTSAGIHAQHFFMPNKFGPNIQASLTFSSPGVYHIFGEFKHKGKVVPTHFMVNVK